MNKYAIYFKIDYMIFPDEGTTFRFDYRDDNFPRMGKEKSINFSKDLFSDDYFLVTEREDYTFVMPRYNNNPIDVHTLELENLQSYSQEQLEVLYYLCTKFGEHIELENMEPLIRRIKTLQ